MVSCIALYQWSALKGIIFVVAAAVMSVLTAVTLIFWTLTSIAWEADMKGAQILTIIGCVLIGLLLLDFVLMGVMFLVLFCVARRVQAASPFAPTAEP